jgi:hypothetical protein
VRKRIGTATSNLLLDSRMDEIKYADGCMDELRAKDIAENHIAQVNERDAHR